MRLTYGRLRALSSSLVTAMALVGCSATPDSPSTPVAVPTVTVTVETTVTAQPTEGSTLEPTAGDDDPSTPAEEEPREVDSDRFRSEWSDDRYAFVSPSGNLECAIFGSEDGPIAGCQGWILVDNLPECDDPMVTSSPAIDFHRGKAAEAYCISDGAFVFDDRQVLQYGEQLRVHGVSCASRPSGIECLDDSSGRGFVAARAGFLPVG